MQEVMYKKMINMDRPKPTRRKMETAHRAKIFAPFAALKGFEEAVRKEEIIYEPQVELPEEKKREIDWKLKRIQKGMQVKIRYFEENSEIPGYGLQKKVHGTVDFFDPAIHLRIGDTEIAVADITSIEGEEFEKTEESC